MANYQILKADIDEKIYENAQQKITGENLNSILNAMVATLGAEYQFAGVATIDTNPETSDAKVFYIANGKGKYTNFGNIEVTEDDVVILYYDTSWHKVATGIASHEKLTELEDKIGNFGTKSFTIEAGNTHSSGVDQLDVNIAKGTDFIIETNIALSSNVMYRGFKGTSGYNMNAKKNLGDGKYLYAAEEDFNHIGLTVFSAVTETTQIKFSVYANAYKDIKTDEGAKELALQIKQYAESNIPVLNKSKAFFLIPNAEGIPNIDTSTKTLNLRNSIICVGGVHYELGDLWPSNPEKYTSISLKNGISSSATKIVFNISTKEIYAIVFSQPLTENEVMIGGVRTTYGINGTFVDASFPFEFTIDNHSTQKIKLGDVKLFSRNIPNIDTSSNTIDLGAFLIVYYNGEYHNFGAESGAFRSIQLKGTSSETTSWKLVFNTESKAFTSVPYDTKINAYKEIVVGTIYLNYSGQFVSAKMPFEFTIDNKFQSDYYNQSAKDYYCGESICLKPSMKHSVWKNLNTNRIVQSATSFGNIIVAMFHQNEGEGKGGIFSATDGNLINEITFPLGGHHYPHNNVCCFGIEKIGNNELPLLYVSQWDYQYERGVFVYNLVKTGDTYNATLVQFIKPSSDIDSNKLGLGQIDWIVDTDSNYLYSVAYKETTDGEGSGQNYCKICKFSLPRVSDGASITLSSDNIIDNFTIEPILYMQDKCYCNGMIFIQYGVPTSERGIKVIDLLGKRVKSKIDLTPYYPGIEDIEPESLFIHDDKLVFQFYGYKALHQLEF